MKKILTIAAALLVSAAGVFAGDAASFDDIGFSADGKYYIFGTYGKTDMKYEPWAEIYTVDVAANNFVKGEVYKAMSHLTQAEKMPTTNSEALPSGSLQNTMQNLLQLKSFYISGILNQRLLLMKSSSRILRILLRETASTTT